MSYLYDDKLIPDKLENHFCKYVAMATKYENLQKTTIWLSLMSISLIQFYLSDKSECLTHIYLKI